MQIPSQAPEDLYGREFVATAITEGGAPREPVGEQPLTVSFERRGNADSVGWRASCNHFGGKAEITAKRLVISQIVGTEMGCEQKLHQHDEWLAAFFDADPEWRLEGERLTLTEGERTIELEEADEEASTSRPG